MKRSARQISFWLLLSLAVIILDQITKWWALTHLRYGIPNPLFPHLNLTLIFNQGAAFSFLSHADGWQRYFFIALALIIGIFIIFWIVQLKQGEVWTKLSLSLILGGALGNAIDRIFRGHVIDFIDFYIGNWHWPTFNLADSAITIGTILLFVQYLRKKL